MCITVRNAVFISIFSILICYACGYNESYKVFENISYFPTTSHMLVKTSWNWDFSYKFHIFNVTEDQEYFQKKNFFNSYKIDPKINIVAESFMKNEINKTGWAYQAVLSNSDYRDEYQAYWAGYLEIAISLKLTKAHMWNLFGDYCKKETMYCINFKRYVKANVDWMKSMVVAHRISEPFWHQIELQLWQIRGQQDAFKGKPVKSSRELSFSQFKLLELDPFGVYLLQMADDLPDLEVALGKTKNLRHKFGLTRCSALIKLLPGFKDLLASHVSWDTYVAMLRVDKMYSLPFHTVAGESQDNSKIIPGFISSFPTYPGRGNSGDDFYITSSNLVTIETTNDIYNKSLYNWVNAHLNTTVLEFMRVQVANRLATSGQDWVNYFAMFNSGTYNNQWMVVDYNKFRPSHPQQTGLLTIIEQIPAFREIFERSGYLEMMKKYEHCKEYFSHDGCPRSRIFSRDQNNVVDLDTMMRLMRYNNYKNDPLSRCNCTPPYTASSAISSRLDLNPANGSYPLGFMGHAIFGATDMKVTNFSMVAQLKYVAISSPTFDQVPVFQWSKIREKDEYRHYLHPDRFDFPPILLPPK